MKQTLHQNHKDIMSGELFTSCSVVCQVFVFAHICYVLDLMNPCVPGALSTICVNVHIDLYFILMPWISL